MRHLFGSMMFIVPGLAMVFFGLRHIARGRASPQWPTASGVIQSSSVEEHRDRRGPSEYCPKVFYSYQVGGVTYNGHQIRDSSPSFNDAQAAQAFADRYPEGSTVQVHYSPDGPWESVLEPGLAGNAWILPAFGGLFLVIGVSGLIQAWRFQAWVRRASGANYS